MKRSGSPRARCRRARLALASCAFLAGAFGCASRPGPPPPPELGSVEGEVRIAGGREPVADLGPVVVYLEDQSVGAAPSSGTLTLLDTGSAPLGHDLVALSRGQALRFASQSGVAHRLFAIRGRERLDVEVPESGESRVLSMDQAGGIRFYCSLHQDEIWDVFVSPSPHFAQLDPDGGYRIENVPPGDYKLSIWSAAVDGSIRLVHVGFGTSLLEPIWLDPAKIDP